MKLAWISDSIRLCTSTLSQVRECIHHTDAPGCRLKDLASRFEAPIEKNRWDSPLFRMEAGKVAQHHALPAWFRCCFSFTCPLTAVCVRSQSKLFLSIKSMKRCSNGSKSRQTLPHFQYVVALYGLLHVKACTRSPLLPTRWHLKQVLSDTNFVYELDKTTQEIIAAILQAQTHAVLGDSVPVPKAQQKISFPPRPPHSHRNLCVLVAASVSRAFLDRRWST